VTFHLPDDDKLLNKTKDELLDDICMAMGGRAAEEIIYNRYDTSAANDISQSTDIARKMVTQWGMTEVLGPINYGQKDEPIFIGKEIATHKDYSEKTAEIIDNEIKKIILDQYQRAKNILLENKDKLIKLSDTLYEKETMEAEEIYNLLGISSNMFSKKMDVIIDDENEVDESEEEDFKIEKI
ncbi:MAG TPA: cell division protein FtsH, partial [Spirochaetota bacterium]|nr:cell division protein FtsH [Spirochaetota bacterium]